MKRFLSLFLVLAIFLSGCAPLTVRKSTHFQETIQNTKVIAVMPPDIEVYKLTAGGVRELMDEWTQKAHNTLEKSLRKHLARRYGFEIKFISKEWLKQNHPQLWKEHKAMYSAVSSSAYKHAFSISHPTMAPFRTKRDKFDYTLGESTAELARVCEADALLFFYGVDHIPTAGRSLLLFWNVVVGAFTGSMYIPLNPSTLMTGLVDGQTGDLEWFKITPPDVQYNFLNEKKVDYLVEWLTRDMLPKK